MKGKATFARWVVGLAVAASAVNVAAVVATPRVSQPVRDHASPALVDILAAEHPTVRREYQLYATLRLVDNARTLIVPQDEILDPYLVEGLSDLEVRSQAYEPDIPTDVGLSLIATAAHQGTVTATLSGEPGAVPYAVSVEDGSDTLRLVIVDGTLLVIDEHTFDSLGMGP